MTKPKRDPLKPPVARNKKLKSCEARAPRTPKEPKHEIALLAKGELTVPSKLESIGALREEMTRVYRLVFQGKLELTQATRLAYLLDRIITALKTEHDVEQAQQAYAKAWSGVLIIGNTQEVIDHAPTPPETHVPLFGPVDVDGG